MKPDSVPELLERISGIDLSTPHYSFSEEIIRDSTPVPFFGDYRSAKIVTVSINPSSHEFPQTQRRLKHLSDIGYESDFFQRGKRLEDLSAIEQIHDGMLNYFRTENWYENWFKMPEMALNIGLSASYFDNKDAFPVRAFHTDLSPWATKRWGGLDRITRLSMIAENRKFLEWILSFEQYEVILLLGSGTTKDLPFRVEISHEVLSSGLVPATFRAGWFNLDNGVRKPYFENTYPPSIWNSKLQKEMLNCYGSFGQFINQGWDLLF